MSDLISRQAAIDAIREDMYADRDYMSGLIFEGIEAVLNSLPSAQPEQSVTNCHEKRGAWLHRWSGDRSTWLEQKCSECGVIFEDEPNDFNFCPVCGADMRGGDNAIH